MMLDLTVSALVALLAGAGAYLATIARLESRDRNRFRAPLAQGQRFNHGRFEPGRLFVKLLPKDLVASLQTRMGRVDTSGFEVEGQTDAFHDELLGRRLLGALVGMVGGLLVIGVKPIGAVAGGFLAYHLWRSPLARHARLRKERRRHFERLLPEALGLLALAIDSGVSFDRGLTLYCGRFDNPISDSFKQAIDERALGKPRRLIFEQMAASVNVDAFTAAIGAILRAEQLGAPLADALRKQAAAARAAHEEVVKELSATAPVKMLVPIAGLILPALLIVIIGPAMLQFI